SPRARPRRPAPARGRPRSGAPRDEPSLAVTRSPAAAVLPVFLLAALPTVTATPPVLATGTAVPSYKWSRDTLKRLTLEEKAAQMVGVRAMGLYSHPRSTDARKLRHLVRDVKVGCVVVFESEVDTLPRLLNELQGMADVPLLVA